MPTPVEREWFRKLETKLPDWLATPIDPFGGYGATICKHMSTGVLTTPWPFGPASRMPSSSASATRSACACTPSSPASPYPAEVRKAALTPFAAQARSRFGVGRRRGADEDEVDLTLGERLDVGHRVDAEHVLALEVRPEDLAAVAVGEQIVERHEAELAGVGGRTGDQHAPRFEQGPELLVGRARPQRWLARFRLADLHQTVDGNQIAGRFDDERVDVDAAHVEPFARELPQAHQQLDQLLAVDRCLTAELAEQLLRRKPVDHVECGRLVERCGAKHHVGDRFGEDATDAEHDHRAELGVVDDAGDQLTIARHHRRDQHVDVAVGGRRRTQQFGRCRFDGRSVTEAQLDQPPLGLVGDRIAVELRHDRIPDLVGGITSRRRSVDETLGSDRHAMGCKQGLRGAFGQGRGASHHPSPYFRPSHRHRQCGIPHPAPAISRRARRTDQRVGSDTE